LGTIDIPSAINKRDCPLIVIKQEKSVITKAYKSCVANKNDV